MPRVKRLHSSRMHTARLLTVSPSMHCAGGSPCQGGLLVGGCLLARGGVSLLGRSALPKGGCLLARGVVSQHALRQTPPPWTEFLTHATENITLPQTSFAGGKKCAVVLRLLPVLRFRQGPNYTEHGSIGFKTIRFLPNATFSL